MKVGGGVEKKGASRGSEREIREGNGGEYHQNILYTCMKLPKNKGKGILKTKT